VIARLIRKLADKGAAAQMRNPACFHDDPQAESSRWRRITAGRISVD